MIMTLSGQVTTSHQHLQQLLYQRYNVPSYIYTFAKVLTCSPQFSAFGTVVYAFLATDADIPNNQVRYYLESPVSGHIELLA